MIDKTNKQTGVRALFLEKQNRKGSEPFFSKRALTPFCFLMIGGSAIAQQSVIDHCKQTSSDADRIACLEAALLGKQAPEPVTHKSIESSAAAPLAAEPTGTESTVINPQGIGASQVIARTETREEQLQNLEKAEGLVVASYATVPFEKLQIALENGQIWRQIKGDTQTIRVDLKRNQTVDIEESSLGGYKMHLNEMRRIVRVERVQ